MVVLVTRRGGGCDPRRDLIRSEDLIRSGALIRRGALICRGLPYHGSPAQDLEGLRRRSGKRGPVLLVIPLRG